jgi:spore germination protein KA
MDAKFQDFINPSSTDKFIKILRYICFFLTVFTPAIYIALINFNQETIPMSLLINFSEQRSGVPFPTIIEAFIMLFICEILRETDIRFPSNYGSSASILGALILGDAAVSAGIVSPIMIIVIAVTFITNLIFTEIKLVWAIRILRVFFLIISTFLGLFGLGIGFITSLSIMANVKMYEGTYL